jgi:hypothetical protein
MAQRDQFEYAAQRQLCSLYLCRQIKGAEKDEWAEKSITADEIYSALRMNHKTRHLDNIKVCVKRG